MLEYQGTPKTVELCQTISRRCKGTCFLSFSRGKDAVATWLFVRQFFDRIIPFHFTCAPHLPMVDRSLDYYEKFFNTKIIRCMEGDAIFDIYNLMYQPPEREKLLDSLNLPDYNRDSAFYIIKKHFNLPSAFVCEGVTGFDAMTKRFTINRKNGVDYEKKKFYPVFDWSKQLLMETIKKSGVKLSPDYRIANRTVSGGPGFRSMMIMPEVYPEDYAVMKAYYPFVDSLYAKNEFRMAQIEAEKHK